jgi:Coenzyme PQQ synthesis protein D (PqqD)
MALTMYPRNILSPLVTIQEVGTETLIYDSASHKAWCLNQSAGSIWRLCNGRNAVSQIASRASAELDSFVSDDLVLLTVAELCKQALIDPDSIKQTPDRLTRREIMSRAGLAAVTLLPVITVLAAPPAARALSGGAGTGDDEAVKDHPLR